MKTHCRASLKPYCDKQETPLGYTTQKVNHPCKYMQPVYCDFEVLRVSFLARDITVTVHTQSIGPYVLGLDLGSASLGWAVLECRDSNHPTIPSRIERSGVRIYEAGVEGDIEQGKDSSRAAKRREARQPRRQNWRTQFRKKKLFQQLQQLGLLPSTEQSDSASRKKMLDDLDHNLRSSHVDPQNHTANQQLPYLLRSLATSKQLEPFELGRAIYNLGQRRGFLSNRKTDTDEKEDGIVKASISELSEQLKDRTLGQMFVEDVDPDHNDPEQQKIRKRYTARSMFHDEFQRIRQVQQPHHQLTDEQWDELFKIIFFQRPLKSQRQRIGKCQIDGGQRCLDALDVYQQFRIWNTVQNLRIADAEAHQREAKLSLSEQKQLVTALQTRATMTWGKVKSAVGLGKVKGLKFTIEEWNKKGLIGHKTNSAMQHAFGDAWLLMPIAERDSITKEVVYFRKPDALRKRGQQVWGLPEDQAALLPAIRLEEGHARHSADTLAKFVDRMKQGEDYSTIRQQLTGIDDSAAMDFLPPLNKTSLEITNPAVIRGLTELRKVVNELIRQYGKPAAIRIEMSRDLKNSRDRRVKLHRDNEDRRRRREKAVDGILEVTNSQRYSGADIEKWLLAEECNWLCPYTGKQISKQNLVGNHSQFDVEHIWPRRYLDNSFANKTLCDAQFNRNVKQDRTAFDACSSLDDWEQILQRVQHFTGPVAALKRKKFLTAAADIPEDFMSKHLNDTRYNAVAAKKYLETLYGGLSDATGTLRVHAVTGGHTAVLRRQWHLDSVLSDDGKKTRNDHRHHAVDAIVIALTDPSRVQSLVNAAELSQRKRSKRFYEAVQDPWPRFIDDVQQSIDEIIVSHRPTRTLAGPLHAESIYSKAHTDQHGNVSHRIRKHITKLSATELKKGKIVDPKIRQLVADKLKELAETNPAKAFAEEKNHPNITTKDGRKIPIHKVRVEADKKPRSIGKGTKKRQVASGKDSNFASMIYAVVDDQGKEIKWEHKVITRLEAHERKSRNHNVKGEKILLPDRSDFDDDKQRVFKLALVKNDTVSLMGEHDDEVLYRVQQLGQGEIQLCPIDWPVMDKNLRSTWNRISSIDKLRMRKLRKTVVSPAGCVKTPAVVYPRRDS